MRFWCFHNSTAEISSPHTWKFQLFVVISLQNALLCCQRLREDGYQGFLSSSVWRWSSGPVDLSVVTWHSQSRRQGLLPSLWKKWHHREQRENPSSPKITPISWIGWRFWRIANHRTALWSRPNCRLRCLSSSLPPTVVSVNSNWQQQSRCKNNWMCLISVTSISLTD